MARHTHIVSLGLFHKTFHSSLLQETFCFLMYDVLLSIYKINLIKKYINDYCQYIHTTHPFTYCSLNRISHIVSNLTIYCNRPRYSNNIYLLLIIYRKFVCSTLGMKSYSEASEENIIFSLRRLIVSEAFKEIWIYAKNEKSLLGVGILGLARKTISYGRISAYTRVTP